MPRGGLCTCGQARIEDGHAFIVGHVQEIIVLTTREKIAHADLATALTEDTLVDQARWREKTCCIRVPFTALNPAVWHPDAGLVPCFG